MKATPFLRCLQHPVTAEYTDQFIKLGPFDGRSITQGVGVRIKTGSSKILARLRHR